MQAPVDGRIFVDNFTGGFAQPGVWVLTHFHSDHYVGLNEHWRKGVIHCSVVTAALVRRFLGVAAVWVQPHQTDVPFEVRDPSRPDLSITGRFVDANHCPGSVMVILDVPGGAGPILHTGDFRWYDGLLDNATLRLAFSPERCQKLYLDVSWADERVMHLPSKQESINLLLDMLDNHPLDTFFLYTKGLGDEEILSAVALHTGENLWIRCQRRYKELEIADVDLYPCMHAAVEIISVKSAI